jgi:hypothetical protein
MKFTVRTFEPAIRHGIEAAITQAWPKFVLEDFYGRAPNAIGVITMSVGHHVAGCDHPDSLMLSVQVALSGLRTHQTITGAQDMFHTDPTEIFHWIRDHRHEWAEFVHRELSDSSLQFSTPSPDREGECPLISYLRQGETTAEERTVAVSIHVHVSLIRGNVRHPVANLVPVR